ncbi:MAG: methylmalonyl-CoA epimerase [Acidobacteriota bacterium]
MLEKIDHIGIAVRSIEERERFYVEGMGLRIDEKALVPEQHARIAIMRIGGIKLELVEPTDPSSPIAGFLNRRGEGIHHICFEVKDIEDGKRKLERAGFKIVENASSVGYGGSKVLFIHPSVTGSVLYELVQHGTDKK